MEFVSVLRVNKSLIVVLLFNEIFSDRLIKKEVFSLSQLNIYLNYLCECNHEKYNCKRT